MGREHAYKYELNSFDGAKKWFDKNIDCCYTNKRSFMRTPGPLGYIRSQFKTCFLLLSFSFPFFHVIFLFFICVLHSATLATSWMLTFIDKMALKLLKLVLYLAIRPKRINLSGEKRFVFNNTNSPYKISDLFDSFGFGSDRVWFFLFFFNFSFF